MGKLATAARLLTSGSFARLGDRWRNHRRTRRLRRAAGRPFVYRLDGLPFACVPGDPDSEELYISTVYDRRELAMLQRWLEPGDAFIDAGANIGVYTLFASRHLGRQGVCLTIEPSPAALATLRAGAGLVGLGNILFEEKAAGDAVKEVTFYTAPAGQYTCEQSIYPHPDRFDGYTPVRMQMTTLAEIAARQPAVARPAAVKVDVEGAELLAIRAAPPAWLGPEGPLWIVEINPGVLARAGASGPEVVGCFPAAAFACWLSPKYPKEGARELPVRKWASDEPFTDAAFYNLIAVPLGPAGAERRRRLEEFFPRD